MHPVAAYSIQQKKILLGNKTPAMDGYGDFFISEGKDGIVDLVRLNGDNIEQVGTVSLPKNDLGDIKTVAVSNGFDRLALSESARGGVWDLSNGAMKIYIRGFRGSHFDPKGQMYADFPHFEKEPRTMAQLDSSTGGGAMLDPIKTRNTKQFGRYLVRTKTKFDEEFEKKQKAQTVEGMENPPPDDQEERKKPTFSFLGGMLTGLDLSDFRFTDTTLEVYDAMGRSLLWSRKYENEAPKYYVEPRAETVTLYWPITSKSAKEIIKLNPDLTARAKSMGEKQGDYFVQVLNASTGTVTGEILIETGEGSFSIERVSAGGDWVAVADSENRLLFYSLKSGDLKSRVFGSKVVLGASRSIAAVENLDGILSIIDLNNGHRLEDLRFPSSIAYVTFNSDESRLFVLTESQQYYVFDVNALRTNL